MAKLWASRRLVRDHNGVVRHQDDVLFQFLALDHRVVVERQPLFFSVDLSQNVDSALPGKIDESTGFIERLQDRHRARQTDRTFFMHTTNNIDFSAVYGLYGNRYNRRIDEVRKLLHQGTLKLDRLHSRRGDIA